MIAPGSATDAESFLWHDVSPRLRLGVAYLHKQKSFRALAGYQLAPEKARTPSLNASAGVQGIGTGNPGYSLTVEKNFHGKEGSLNVFSGLGVRSNEDHVHGVAGIRYRWHRGPAVGIQLDGHQANPFAVFDGQGWLAGVYLIDGKKLAYLVGSRW